AAGDVEQRICEIEAAENPADLGIREMELLLDARQGNREVVAQEIVDEAQHEQQAENTIAHRHDQRAGERRDIRIHMSLRWSAIITCAALWPGAPVTPPPGCVPAPQRYKPSIGVR